MRKVWIPACVGIFFSMAAPLLAQEVSTATLTADKILFDGKTKTGHAEGNVRLEQSSSTLTGDVADYNWGTDTGTILDVTGVNPPWRFTAEKMKQATPDLFYLEDGSLTSCDEVPPHYRIKARHSKMVRGKRITMTNASFVPGDTSVLWLPVYTRSLVPKKYRLRIEPGYTGRDGFTAKSSLAYPFTPNTWTTFRWDYLENTGNGFGLNHAYNTPDLKGNFDTYYVKDTNPDPQPESTRYTVLWNHYQKLTSRLSANAKVDIKSDQIVGNQFNDVGNQVLVENQTRGLLSEGGFNYQLPKVNFQAQFDRKDKFDSTVSSRQFVSHLTLPALSFNTAPLTAKKIPFYTSFNGSYTNDTQERDDPAQSLRYKRNATAGFESKQELRVTKKLTLTPLLAYKESWDNRVLGSSAVITERDQYVGRYTTGLDVRRRFFRIVDLRLGYRYGARNQVNRTEQDSSADDHGVETNQMTGAFQTRVGRSNLVTLSSGYDYRSAPRSQPDKYTHVSERVLPQSLDTQWELKQDVNLFFRETYSIFDSVTRTPVRTPVNTSGELQLGNPNSATLFTQGFSYSKNLSTDSQLFLNNKVKFFLSSKWYVDLLLSYRAVGPSGMNYQKVHPIERTIRIVRDLHCWLFRAEFSSRPGVKEATFYIDLKTNASGSRNVFTNDHPSVYSTRNDGPDYGELFPDTDKHGQQK